jgi:hypothetical protein
MNTMIGTPNLLVSNVKAVDVNPSDPTDFDLLVKPDAVYFEIVGEYPRNHYTHKATQFSKTKYPKYITSTTSSIFVKSRQSMETTISENGLDDGSLPVQSTNVSNVNVINVDNVLGQ